MVSITAGGDIGTDGVGHIINGHGLQPHTAGAGEDGVEQALAAEEDVLGALHLLDVHVDTGLEAGHITGIHDDALTGLEDVLHQIAVDLHEGSAVAGKSLHDEALTTKEAGAEPLVEVDGQLHAGLRCQKRALLDDHLLSGCDIEYLDLTGERRGECDHAGAAPGGVMVLEHALAGKGLGEHPSKTAAVGLHLHVGAHPGHGTPFGDHLLTIFQIANDNGKAPTLDFISHNPASILILIYRQAFRMPAAIAIITTGTSNAMPVRKIRHTSSAGMASPINMKAEIFAAPQVSFSARPMVLTSNQPKITTVNNPNIFRSLSKLPDKSYDNDIEK